LHQTVPFLPSQPGADVVLGFCLGSEYEWLAYPQSTWARKSRNCTHQPTRRQELAVGGGHKNRGIRSSLVRSIPWSQSLEVLSRCHRNQLCERDTCLQGRADKSEVYH